MKLFLSNQSSEKTFLRIPVTNYNVFKLILGFSSRPIILICPTNKPSFFKLVNKSPTAGTKLIILDINLIGAKDPLIKIVVKNDFINT